MRPEDYNNDTENVESTEADKQAEQPQFEDPRAELTPLGVIVEMLRQGDSETAIQHLLPWVHEFPDNPAPIPNPKGFASDFKAALFRNGVPALYGIVHPGLKPQDLRLEIGGHPVAVNTLQTLMGQAQANKPSKPALELLR